MDRNKIERTILLALLVLTLGVFVGGLVALVVGRPASKLLTSAGLLATVAGLVQLEVSGFIARIVEFYADEEKFPYGPPSHFTRQILEVDNPDRPYLTALFFEPRFGFWLIVAGTVAQVFGVWV